MANFGCVPNLTVRFLHGVSVSERRNWREEREREMLEKNGEENENEE
jgi:hypothetical protein